MPFASKRPSKVQDWHLPVVRLGTLVRAWTDKLQPTDHVALRSHEVVALPPFHEAKGVLTDPRG
jgi:hypothetical protein